MRRCRCTTGFCSHALVLTLLIASTTLLTSAAGAAVQPPEGFTALFNGTDLTGWKGLLRSTYDNPAKRAKL